jgi:phosphoglycolate phosphatase
MPNLSRRAEPRFAGFVFDLDGTLVDTLGEITSALNEALSVVGEKACSHSEVRRWVGDGVARLVEKALPDRDEGIHRRVQKLVVDQFAANDGGRSLPYSGMVQTLQELEGLSVPLAVLTNKVEEAAVAQVARTFGTELFCAVRGLTVPGRGKPDPTSLLELVAMLGVEADSVAMVGDTEVDLQTARAAGVGAIAVTWGFRDREELAARSPDYLVDAPSELLSMLRIKSRPVRIFRCDGSSGLD